MLRARNPRLGGPALGGPLCSVCPLLLPPECLRPISSTWTGLQQTHWPHAQRTPVPPSPGGYMAKVHIAFLVQWFTSQLCMAHPEPPLLAIKINAVQ